MKADDSNLKSHRIPVFLKKKKKKKHE